MPLTGGQAGETWEPSDSADTLSEHPTPPHPTPPRNNALKFIKIMSFALKAQKLSFKLT
jgi:hypothetical protein